MHELRENNDAVLVAGGLGLARSTHIPGSEHEKTITAIDVLRDITNDTQFSVPKSAVVIGGGNVAMDAARSLARYQRQKYGQVDVTITALEAGHQMLADQSEIRESTEEGITIMPGRGPRKCIIKDGALVGLETVLCKSVFDDAGRFHPEFDESDVIVHNADLVVEAIGQAADVSYFGEEVIESLEWQRGRLQIDNYGRTAEQWLWAAGDMVEGPDVVHAVAAGHRVATSMHDVLVAAGEKNA